MLPDDAPLWMQYVHKATALAELWVSTRTRAEASVLEVQSRDAASAEPLLPALLTLAPQVPAQDVSCIHKVIRSWRWEVLELLMPSIRLLHKEGV